MNRRTILRICHKNLSINILRSYSYKAINRPDPAKLKLPAANTSLKLIDLIQSKIKLSGPMTVADYMHIVATNPVGGYYMKKEIIGEGGDFITSPEISQLFGEIIAIWFYTETLKMFQGKPLQVVELGPGKGTLLIDVLRTLSRIGYRQQDLSLHLVEISPIMQNEQAHRLCMTHKTADENMPHYYEGETASGIKVYWYNDLSKVPQRFSWYIAHEFFDALPIHKFEKTPDGWRELLIDIDGNNKLHYRISGKETRAVQLWIRPPLDSRNTKELEVNVKGLSIARQLAQRVDQSGGIALIVDYGHEGEKGDTFRAFHKHKVVNPLENPGECDLTADVDFSQLKIAASKASEEDNFAIVVGPCTQRDFLIRAEAESRLQVLLDNSKEEDKDNLKAAYEMLTSPQKMGDRFKFMAFYPSAMANILEKYPPLGFSTLKTEH